MISTSEIAIIIICAILGMVAVSAIGGLILWGCGRGIAKIEKATFLNGWGLWWILYLTNIFFYGILYFIFYAIIWESNNPSTFLAVLIIIVLIYYIISVWVALGITKAFWKCSWKQSFMTHLIPMIIYFLTQLIGWIMIFTSAPRFYY